MGLFFSGLLNAGRNGTYIMYAKDMQVRAFTRSEVIVLRLSLEHSNISSNISFCFNKDIEGNILIQHLKYIIYSNN